MPEQLVGDGLQGLNIRLNIAEQVACDVRLQRRRLGQGVLQHGLHGRVRDFRNGGLLLGICLFDNGGQIALLIKADSHKGGDQPDNDDQHQVENFLLQPADLDSVNNFHNGFFGFLPRIYTRNIHGFPAITELL